MSYDLPYDIRLDPSSTDAYNAMSNTFAIENNTGSTSYVGHRYMPFFPINGKSGTTSNPDLTGGFYETNSDTIITKDYENLSLSNYSFDGFAMARTIKDMTLRGTINGKSSYDPTTVDSYVVVVVVDAYITSKWVLTGRNLGQSQQVWVLNYVSESIEEYNRFVGNIPSNVSFSHYAKKGLVQTSTAAPIREVTTKYVTRDGTPINTYMSTISPLTTIYSMPHSVLVGDDGDEQYQLGNYEFMTEETTQRIRGTWYTIPSVSYTLTRTLDRSLFDEFLSRTETVDPNPPPPSFFTTLIWNFGGAWGNGEGTGPSFQGGGIQYGYDINEAFLQLKAFVPKRLNEFAPAGGGLMLIAGGNIDLRGCTIDVRGGHFLAGGGRFRDTDGFGAGGGSVILIAGGEIIMDSGTRILYGGGEGNGRIGSSGRKGGAGFSVIASSGVKRLPNTPPDSLVVPATQGTLSFSAGAQLQYTINKFNLNKEIEFGYYKDKLNFKKYINIA